MAKNKHLVAGGFNTVREAQLAVDALDVRGVPVHEVSVLVAESQRDAFVAIEKGNKAAEGAGTGGAVGTGLGALAAGLTAVAGIAIPGVGLLAAGPLVAALAGAGAGGALGAALGGLAGAAITEHEAKFLENTLTEGGVLVVVTTDADATAKVAKHVFDERAAKSKETVGQIART